MTGQQGDTGQEETLTKEFVTVREASQILGISIDTVRRWEKAGKIHAVRLDGKNRYFDVEELEQFVARQPLSSTEVAALLGVSPSTVRRLEQQGLLHSARNHHGKRLYDRENIDVYIAHKDLPTTGGEVVTFAAQPQEQLPQLQEAFAGVAPTPALQQPASQQTLPPNRSSLSLQKFSNGLVSRGRGLIPDTPLLRMLYALAAFLGILVILTVLFRMFPQRMDRSFGWGTSQTPTGPVGNSTFPLLWPLKPVASVARNLNKDRVPPQASKIQNVKDVLKPDSDGNLITQYGLGFPNSSYIKVPDPGLVANLNSEYVGGRKPGSADGDLAILPITGDKIQDAAITGADIAKGTIQLTNLSPALQSLVTARSSSGSGATGAQGPVGPTGATGPQGPQGPSGSSSSAGVSSVVAGDGLQGGGSTSTVTLDIETGDSTTIVNNAVEVKLAAIGTTTSTSSASGLEVSAQGLRLVGGCSTNQILKWNGSAWACAADSSGSGGSLDISESDGSPTASGTTSLEFGPTSSSSDQFVVTNLGSGQARVTLGANVLQTTNYAATLDSIYANATETPTAGDISGSYSAGFTVAANAVALGTDTTGNYLATLSGGTGLSVSGSGSESAAATISLDVTTTSTTGTSSSNSGLELGSDGLRLLGGCSNGEILKWNGSVWACASDANSGTIAAQEDDSTVTSVMTTIDFLGSDFDISETPAGEVNVEIDYTNSAITRANQAATVTGSWTFTDSGFALRDNIDTTKQATFQLSGISASTSRSLIVPDASGTIITTGNLSDITAVGTLTSGTWQGMAVGAQYGGTGVNGASAANGSLLIGNGSGYALATLSAGSGIGVSNGAGSISISASLGTSIGNAEIDADAVTLGTQTTGNYVQSVVAGNGLTGDVASEGGTASLAIGAGNGISAAADSISVVVQANRGLEVDGSGLSLIDCSSGEVLKYNGTNQWACAADNGTGSAPTLDDSYGNDPNGSNVFINLTSADGALLIRDSATPLGSTLFAVQNSTGGTSYFDVSSTGITTSGTINGLGVSSGTVTSGTWNGTALTDAYVSDTLTSSNFVGSGSSTNAVDLATAEVAGNLRASNLQTAGTDLGAANVNIDLTNTNGAFVTNLTIDGTVTAGTFSGALAGNAATATALAANPSDCSANQFATSIVANGDLTCAALTDSDIPNSITVDIATAANALAANPSDCSANQFATTIAANGNLTCAGITDADVPDSITVTLASTATALAANPSDCAANQFATTIAASGNLTCATITASNLPVAAADLGAADVNLNFGNTNGSFNTNLTLDGTITASIFAGALSGNATTATALAANPTDCSSNQFATAIAANGSLTCAALTDADIPNSITIDLASTATALAANPTDCGANEFATTIAADGDLTCANLTDSDVPDTLTIDANSTVDDGALSANVTKLGSAIDLASAEVSGNLLATNLQSAGADLGAANITVNLSNTNGSFVTNVTTDGTITATIFNGDLTGNVMGDITGNLLGNVSGNADTATTLAANPSDCAANQFATSIAASGDLTCAALIDADIPDSITIDLATEASALAANPTDCGADAFATAIAANGDLTCGSVSKTALANTGTLGFAWDDSEVADSLTIDGSGTVDDGALSANVTKLGSAIDLASAEVSGNLLATNLQSAGADLGAANVTVNLSNTNGAFVTHITTDGTITAGAFSGDLTGNVTGDVLGNVTGDVTGNLLGDVTGDLTGNADTATALAANPSDCSVNQFATTIAASGNLACAALTDGDVPNSITIDLASAATALAANPADCSANSFATTIAASGDLSCASIAADNLPSASADLGAANVTINLSNSNGSFVTNLTVDGIITAGGFNGDLTGDVLGNVTGSLIGNADTATALAANPSDCGANQFATTIAANGNLTCAALTDSDIPNSITIDLASAATALAANPSDCSANQFANAIVASGNLTCAALTDGDIPNSITVDLATAATALAANPSDCSANQFATTIAASGNLTCAALTDGDIPNSITVDLATAASALAANPSDCSANQFATTIAADGNLTCAAITDADVSDTLTASNFVGSGSTSNAIDLATAEVAGNLKASSLQSAAADLGAADVTVNFGNTNGSFNTNITTDGTVTASTFIGALTGNASTATALAANPSDCSANQFATTIAASGNLTCAALTDGDVPNSITIDLATAATALAANPSDCSANQFANAIAASGNLTCAALTDGDIPNSVTIDLATAATALAANPSDCSANQFATTIAASGNLSCSALAATNLPTAAADLGAADVNLNFGNTNGAFNTNLTLDGTITAATFSGALTGNASTATALAANPSDCSANQFANAIAASGNLTCAALTDGDIPNTITIDLASAATALAANPSDCSANQFATTIAASGALTCAAIAANNLPSAAADLGAANVTIDLGNTNGAFNTNITIDGTLTAGSLVGPLTGNASTATALAADPTDCSANQFAMAIAASGNLTCAGITDADVSNTLTASLFVGSGSSTNAIDLATAEVAGNLKASNLQSAAADLGAADVTVNFGNTNGSFNTNITTDGTITATTFVGALTGNASTATALAANPSDCSANQFATTIAASGNLTCSSIAANNLPSAAADLGAANVTIDLGNTNGAFVTNLTTDGTITAATFSGALSGNASTATALAANPSDCSANQFATTIAASGNLTCASITDADVPDGITVTLAATATALAANPSDCSANQFATAIAASGNLTCASLTDGDVPDTITVNLAAAATALAADPTDCSANQFATAIAASGNLSCAALTASNLPSAAANLGAADVTINLGNTNGSFNTNITTDGNITATTFIGALTGNASTATALAANPADCGANQFATTIAASGALTCASITDADVPDGITVTLAATATALAANPSDCGANTFATTIAASGNLTCASVNVGTADITGNLKATNLQNAAADLGAANVTVDLSNTNGAFVTNLTVDGTITTVGTIGTASTTTFTGAGATFSSAVAANGGITFDSSADTLGAFTFGGTVDANANILTNIGNAGTDFIASTGALTLAGILTGNGGATINRTLSANSGSTVNVASVTFSTPADSSGTNVSQGLNITSTIGNASGGTNTANIINIAAVTGDAQVSLNAINIGNLTGTAATENAINLGTGWDSLISGTTAGTNLFNFTNFTTTSAGAVTAASTIRSNTGFNVNGTAGITVAACTAAQYIGNGVTLAGGITTAGSCHADGVSDARTKRDVTDTTDVLDKLGQVRTVNFAYKCEDTELARVTGMNCNYNNYHTGVIAQEIAQIFPDLVFQDENGYYNVKYQELSVYTLKGVQELNKKVNDLIDGDTPLNTIHAQTVDVSSLITDYVATPYHVTERVAAGDVVVTSGNGLLSRSTAPAQKGLVGVVADASGFDSNGTVAVAAAGKVTVKVTGPVAAGDAITSSAISGVGAKASTPGPIVGTAVTAFSGGGVGQVTIVVSPGYYGGDSETFTDIQDQLDDLQTQISASNVNLNDLEVGRATINLDAIVNGSLTVNGETNFNNLVNFGKPVVFDDDVVFNGNVSFNNNTGGYATLNPGQTTVHVSFSKPYTQAPIISLTPGSGASTDYRYENVTAHGFDIVIGSPAAQALQFSWIALSVNGATTSTSQ